MTPEGKFKAKVTRRLRDLFPGCVILKNDAGYLQGIPDTTVLFQDRWAVLEFKRSSTAPPEPNQPYYVDLLNQMSYAAFIYPENEEEVIRGLQQAFAFGREPRPPQS